MTKTEQLTDAIRKIGQKHARKIKKLPTRTPRGGSNGAKIKGWVHSPNGTISRACNLAGIATLPYWSGFCPTPATAIPACIEKEAIEAYEQIFHKQD